jgi:hypothetical protein
MVPMRSISVPKQITRTSYSRDYSGRPVLSIKKKFGAWAEV